MSIEEPCRVLSIQSHVVSGHVGNKAAVFPLQVLGFDVDFINSVHFSTHTGYPHRPRGSVLTGADLATLAEGLLENHLLHYDYLLTGYIGSESFLFSILKVLDDIKRINPSAKYVCDPVLGDNNQYYVPVGLVETFKTELIPRAYMITPNQFEAELLTGTKIRTEEDAVRALVQLHNLGPEIVVLTSAELSDNNNTSSSTNTDVTTTDSTTNTESEVSNATSLHCYVCYPAASAGGGSSSGDKLLNITRIEISKIEGNFTGTGDATAALMLAWVHLLTQELSSASSSSSGGGASGSNSESGEGTSEGSNGIEDPISMALRNSLATVKAMLVRSSQVVQKHYAAVAASASASSSASGSSSTVVDAAEVERIKCNFTRAKELQVVRSKRDIECPPVQDLHSLSAHTWQVKG